MRHGSCCTGYGGLDDAALDVLGGELAWCADNAPGPAAILAAAQPAVRNLGDITTVNWAGVPTVDVLTAGFPCQDVSVSGRRTGLRAGTRTGVWTCVANAITVLRPRLVFLENVEGLRSGWADSDMELCPECLGNRGKERALRALGAVLGSLAEARFDAEWCSVTASEAAGCCHRRERVFILAWPQPEPDAHAGHRLVTARARDAQQQAGQRPPVRQEAGGHSAAAENSYGESGQQRRQPAPGQAPGGRARADASRPGGMGDDIWWGPYEPAIRRWEWCFGRPAPRPAVPLRPGGAPRLSTLFAEWMMGLEAGRVTGVPGVTRDQMLAALGNGVVPQQAAYALRVLLARAGADLPPLVQNQLREAA